MNMKRCLILLLSLLVLLAGCAGGQSAPADAGQSAGAVEQTQEPAPQEDTPDDQTPPDQPQGEPQTVEIWLSRHGQTIANAKDVCAGWSDAPLTDTGVEFTRYVGQGLKDEGVVFTAVYSSDLGRCLQTAEILLDTMDLSLPVQPDKRLREMHMGDYELESFSQFLEDYPNVYNFEEFEGIPGGENWDTLLERVQPALEDIGRANSETGGKILVTTHGYVIVDVIRMFDPDFYISSETMPNNSITVLEYRDGQLSLKSLPTSAYGERGMELAGVSPPESTGH